MKAGTYRDRDGVLVAVEPTESGYLIRYPDGTVISLPR